MSYILDAIKKSEQQRQRSKGASLDAPIIAPYTEPSNSLLLYGLIAASLLALGLIITLLHPWREDTPQQMAAAEPTEAPPQTVATPAPPVITPSAPAPAAPTSASAPAPAAQPLPKPAKVEPQVKVSKPTVQEKAPVAPAKAEVAAHSPLEVTQHEPKTESKIEIKAETVVTEKPVPAKEATAALETPEEIPQQNRLLEITELPPSIQQDLPEISIAGFAYSSNPRERSVGINGRLLQEGDYIKPGMRLERINADGLVFGYKGYHFRQSLQ